MERFRGFHRKAPFLFFNGNTFATIGRELSFALFSDLVPGRKREVGSAVAHYIAGVLDKDFVRAGQAVNLTASGRKRFFQPYEQRMSSLITHPLFDYKVSYRRALELQARLLAKTLTGELREYVPMVTR